MAFKLFLFVAVHAFWNKTFLFIFMLFLIDTWEALVKINFTKRKMKKVQKQAKKNLNPTNKLLNLTASNREKMSKN